MLDMQDKIALRNDLNMHRDALSDDGLLDTEEIDYLIDLIDEDVLGEVL